MSKAKQVKRVHVAKDFHDWLKIESVKKGKSMIEYSKELSEQLKEDGIEGRRKKFDTRFF